MASRAHLHPCPDPPSAPEPGAAAPRPPAPDPTRPPGIDPTALARVVRAALADPSPLDGPEVLRLTPDPERRDATLVAARPTPGGCHPVDALVGLAADPDWLAVGIRARGRAAPLDGSPPAAVRTAHLVAVDGSWASAWVEAGPGGAGGEAHGAAGDPSAPSGRVDDACRRALGLPTAPPPATTGVLWTVRWLDAVVDEASTAAGLRRLRRWAAVAAHHPAAGPHPAGGQPAPGDRRSGPPWDRRRGPDPLELARLGVELEASTTWADLRRAAAAHQWAAPGVDALTAAWLDDGAFARWVLGSLPDLDDLLEAAAALLPDPCWTALATTLGLGGRG